MTFKAVIRSMRLRTLPLSMAGIVLGIMLACAGHSVPWYVIVLTILTTVSLQILSNMSNELGDWLSGVDGQGREGPKFYTLHFIVFNRLVSVLLRVEAHRTVDPHRSVTVVLK